MFCYGPYRHTQIIFRHSFPSINVNCQWIHNTINYIRKQTQTWWLWKLIRPKDDQSVNNLKGAAFLQLDSMTSSFTALFTARTNFTNYGDWDSSIWPEKTHSSVPQWSTQSVHKQTNLLKYKSPKNLLGINVTDPKLKTLNQNFVEVILDGKCVCLLV